MRDSDDVKGAGRSGLIEDVALTEADIQNLTSLESLVILFARLGYNTNARVIQTVDALGISNDTLRSVIKRIELVARNQDSYGLDFEVYLIQVQSLRASVRNELVRHFRRYGIRQLLILTDTFRRYDFVMLESYTVELETEEGKLQANPLQAELQPNLRQLLFQIDLNKKDTRANRILSRFSWTESDAEAQYEKLLHVFQMATWSTKYFNNRALFSDYYLSERLPSRSEWQQERKRSSLDKAYRRLTDFYEKPEQYIGRSESWLRAQLLEPVLLQLGFVTRPVKLGEQPKLPLEKLPEQTLVLSAASESDQSAKPLALFLGYPWGRNLDGKDDLRDSLTPEANPGAEVVRLLDSGLAEWVVLTNGIYWRLYSANAHSRTANYYEMNLQEILELEPDTREEAFHYFWMLFKASSFLPTIRSASDNERLVSLLDEILIQSDLYARDLGDRLKLRVFEQIFPEFAEGFIQHARRVGLLPANLDRLAETEREALLKPYFTGTLTFLYRLLFLLYAESRELLPMRHEPYYAHSLESLKQRIAQHAGSLED